MFSTKPGGHHETESVQTRATPHGQKRLYFSQESTRTRTPPEQPDVLLSAVLRLL